MKMRYAKVLRFRVATGDLQSWNGDEAITPMSSVANLGRPTIARFSNQLQSPGKFGFDEFKPRHRDSLNFSTQPLFAHLLREHQATGFWETVVYVSVGLCGLVGIAVALFAR